MTVRVKDRSTRGHIGYRPTRNSILIEDLYALSLWVAKADQNNCLYNQRHRQMQNKQTDIQNRQEKPAQYFLQYIAYGIW
jgi:hypothetical protein